MNLGYSGARTENILWNIQNGELDGQSPKVITLMIGTNNADAKNYPTHHDGRQIAGGIRAIVAALKAKCPTAKILLLRCFPGARRPRSDLPPRGPGLRFGTGAETGGRQAGLLLRREPRLPESRRLDQQGIDARLAASECRGGHAGRRPWSRCSRELMGDTSRDTAIPVNTATVPVPKLENDSYDWYARHAAVLGAKDKIDPEIVLIGDSITHFWGGEPQARQANGPKAWASVFAPYRVLNLGFGWDRTQNVLWRLDRGELDGLHPRTVIIHIGTNNTSQTAHARQNTPAEIVAGIAAICGRVHSKVPGVRIILMQVMPREEKPDHPRRARSPPSIACWWSLPGRTISICSTWPRRCSNRTARCRGRCCRTAVIPTRRATRSGPTPCGRSWGRGSNDARGGWGIAGWLVAEPQRSPSLRRGVLGHRYALPPATPAALGAGQEGWWPTAQTIDPRALGIARVTPFWKMETALKL